MKRALEFTFIAHGAAMLGMLAFLLPLVPGGTGGPDDLARMEHIASSALAYRLGWAGWQITALSDILFAVALFRMTRLGTRARTWALVTCVCTVLAVLPDQAAQFLLVTRGVELARMGAEAHDATDFLAYENVMFPLTTGWAACFYTLGAVGWAMTLRSAGIWNRLLARLTAPMLALFAAISIAPILPLAWQPKAAYIGGGNALAFTILEGWFVAVWWCLRAQRSATDAEANAKSATSTPK